MGLGLHAQVQPPLHVLYRFPAKPARATRHARFLNLGFPDDANCLQFTSQLRLGARRRLPLKSARKLSTGRVVGALGESDGAVGGLFWQPFWSSGGNLVSKGLEGRESRGGGVDGGGDGIGGGGGGDGDGVGGSGGFDSSGGGLHVGDAVVERGSEDEEGAKGEVPVRGGEFRAPVLASLSSAAGDALDGEAPLGDLVFGRKKRAGIAEETAANVPSRASDKGTAGGILRKIDKAAHTYLNFLSPSNANQQERSGKNSHLREIECVFMQCDLFVMSLDCKVTTLEVETSRPCWFQFGMWHLVLEFAFWTRVECLFIHS